MNKKKLFREFFMHFLFLICIYFTAGTLSDIPIFWMVVALIYIYINKFFNKD